MLNNKTTLSRSWLAAQVGRCEQYSELFRSLVAFAPYKSESYFEFAARAADFSLSADVFRDLARRDEFVIDNPFTEK